jgi:predicted MPP superfamily phosphohydrolase
MFLLEPSAFHWDLGIALLLATGLCVTFMSGVWLWKPHKRQIMASMLVSIIGMCGATLLTVVAYGSFIEPQLISVTEASVRLPLRNRLKIAVIADLHLGPYKGARYLERVVRRVNMTLPDIVLLAGDYFWDDEGNLEDLEPLRGLRASLGVFAVTGDHEHGRYMSLRQVPPDMRNRSHDIASQLRTLGVVVLRNEHVTLRLTNDTLAIAGIDDVWSEGSDLPAALRGIPSGIPTILLSHNPDVILENISHRANLIVTGHTHGGQIRLPWYGPIAALPTHIGSKYDQGIFALDDDTTLAITRGVGESLARARLFAPPEIMLLETP